MVKNSQNVPIIYQMINDTRLFWLDWSQKLFCIHYLPQRFKYLKILILEMKEKKQLKWSKRVKKALGKKTKWWNKVKKVLKMVNKQLKST